MYRPTHKKHVLQILESDRAVHAQIRPRTQGKGVVDSHVHRNRAVNHRWIDSRNVPVYHPVPRIDRSYLSRQHVFGLRLRNLDFRFEFLWISHPRQVCAGSHVLADVHWHKLQYAIDARANM